MMMLFVCLLNHHSLKMNDEAEGKRVREKERERERERERDRERGWKGMLRELRPSRVHSVTIVPKSHRRRGRERDRTPAKEERK